MLDLSSVSACGPNLLVMMDLTDARDVSMAPPGADTAAWGALIVDLDGLDGVGDVVARRRGVALRLLAGGLTLEALDAVLPGWGRYLDAG